MRRGFTPWEAGGNVSGEGRYSFPCLSLAFHGATWSAMIWRLINVRRKKKHHLRDIDAGTGAGA